MAASVRTEDEAFGDMRYERLAELAGLADADHARGKMLKLWRQCTLEHRYVLPECDVVRVLGARGVHALVDSRLGEVVDDGVRIRGTRGRIEWLKKLRSNGKFGKLGGRPRKTHKGSQENPEGFENETPPAPAPAPARSQRERKRARALPEDWEPELTAASVAAEAGKNLAQEAARFRDWALGKGELKADWDAAFRNWLRRSFAGNNGPGAPSRFGRPAPNEPPLYRREDPYADSK